MLLQYDGSNIFLFPAWPRDWSVSFKLSAPQNTVVEAACSKGFLTHLLVSPPHRRAQVSFPGRYIYVSSYYYICVLILLYVSSYCCMCPHTAVCVWFLLYVCGFCCMCVVSRFVVRTHARFVAVNATCACCSPQWCRRSRSMPSSILVQ